jgi:hypothetical protein
LLAKLSQKLKGGRDFQNVSYSGGFAHRQKRHGVGFGDGDQDSYQQMGDAYPSALYLNLGHDARWIGLDLMLERGVTAMGAWIEVDVDAADGGTRALYRTLNTWGSFSSSSLRQEIGLGAAKSICEVRIT